MKTDNLKYKAEIDALNPNLDPYFEREVECYRFTFDNINNPLNFAPVYKADIKRYKQSVEKGTVTYKGFGLSLYEKKELAISEYNNRINRTPLFYKKAGTHIAKGIVTKENGISNPCEVSSSHFTLLESINTDLSKNFIIESKLH